MMDYINVRSKADE